MKNILLIAGTRPNFVKLAPLYHRLKIETEYLVQICHTGQHFDRNMSDSFFECLEIPAPDFNLNVRGNSVPDTIGKTMVAINEVLQSHSFDLVVVFGDVNATVAGAIAAVQSGIKVMHVEAGLRSFDRRMPEEINRMLTDSISDFLMVSEPSGIENLKKEGVSDDKVFYVGNIMIESLIKSRPKWDAIGFEDNIAALIKQPYVLATFHRPENVDDKAKLQSVVTLLENVSAHIGLIFPVHPRTKARLKEIGLYEKLSGLNNVVLCDPLGYFEFLKLTSQAKFVLTDSGGIQEETTYLGIPCITFRNNTERPVTIKEGTNVLMDITTVQEYDDLKLSLGSFETKSKSVPLFWDDQVSKRIILEINKIFLKPD